MSRAIALVKFLNSGNIYATVYEGTSDILVPFLFTYDEYKNTSIYNEVDKIIYTLPWKMDDNTPLEPVEIYSDYGGGFYWQGMGSEALKKVGGPLEPFGYDFDNDFVQSIDGQPDWVIQYFNAHK